MFLSVIVPTCNRNDLLDKCLQRLAPSYQTINSLYYEVIVTDDSKDNSAKQLIDKQYNWATWLHGPRKGPAGNRNSGAKSAKGDWLVFIDDDCLPSAGLLLAYYNIIKGGKYKALEGSILSERPKQRFDEVAPLNISGGKFWSCNIAIEKNIFWQIDGFDESFPYPSMEDIDLHKRIKSVTTTFFVKEAEVIHPWRRVIPFRNYKRKLKSNKYFLSKLNTKTDFSFRVLRLKLLIGNLVSDLRELSRYSFKGVGYFIERIWFNVLMIFV